MADRFPAELPMRFTTTSDGVRIAYGVVGDGPTCVFAYAPGACHSALQWELFREVFLPYCERLRSVFFDWRNTGLSGTTQEGFTIEAGQRDLEAVINAAAPRESVAIHAVTGAPFAVLPYAASNPDKVARVALVTAAVNGKGMPRSWFSWHELIDEEPELAVRFSASAGGLEPNRKFERFLSEAAPLHYTAWFERLLKTLDVSRYLQRVTCPVLVVGRRELPWPTATEAAQTAAAFPQGRLLMLDGGTYGVGEEPPPALLDFLAGGATHAEVEHAANGDCLSARELDVLRLIAAGRTNPEIAEALTIAPATASKHVHHILEKLGMSRRSEAAAYALREGLVK